MNYLVILFTLIILGVIYIAFVFGEKRGSFGYIINGLVRLLTFSITILCFLFALYSDVIIQNNNDIRLPFKNIRSDCSKETNLEEILVDSEKSYIKPTFIFALDNSESLKFKGNDDLKWAFKSVIGELNSLLLDRDLNFSENLEETPYNICRVKLAHLISELGGVKGYFSIWAFDKEAYIVYPKDSVSGYLSITEYNIRNGIKAIRKLSQRENRSQHRQKTNYIDLFSEIITKYKLINNKEGQQSKPSKYILLVLSDLEHDNFNNSNQDLKEDFLKDKELLLNQIRLLGEADLIGNMMVPTEAIISNIDERIYEDKNQVHIWPHLMKYFEKSNLESFSVSENNQNLHFDNIITTNSILFQYLNSKRIDSSSFVININRDGYYRFGLTNPHNNLAYKKFTINYKVLKFNNEEKVGSDYYGKLKLGDILYRKSVYLSDGDKLVLYYRGPLPYNYFDLGLRIYTPNKLKYSYIIPIEFVKRLPASASIIMVSFIVTSLISFLVLVFVLIVKIFSNADQNRFLVHRYGENL